VYALSKLVESLSLPKEDIEHGQWLPWLKDNFGWSEAWFPFCKFAEREVVAQTKRNLV